jgi:hypothetical protein
MGDTIKIVIAPSIMGFTGVKDCLNPQYIVSAKQSMWATIE